MPSTEQPSAGPGSGPDAGDDLEVENAAFVDVDWDDATGSRFRPDRRTIGFLVALAGVGLLFAYDYTVSPEYLLDFLHPYVESIDSVFLRSTLKWDLTRVDWLFITSMVLLVRYGIVPVVEDRERAKRSLKAFARRPAGLFSLLYIVVFGFIGMIGPDRFFGAEYAKLKYRYQPPFWETFPVDKLSYYNCYGEVVDGMCHGSMEYPLGTTRFGQSMLRMVMNGVRIALQLGVTAGMLMALIATVVGVLAGYYGGLIDDVLMGYVDIQQTVPAIVVYIILATMFLGNRKGVTDGEMFALILVFGLLNWGGMARLVRSGAMQRREEGYVRAAKAAGASNFTIIRRHIIPNSKATIVTSLTRQIPMLILAQVVLAYLNLNRIGTESLGRIFRFAHIGHARVGAGVPWFEKWWVTVFPAIFLIVTVLAFNLLGDTIRDVMDPQEKVE